MGNKSRRLISIPQDLDQRLDNVNASALICDLLENHFCYLSTDDPELLEKKKLEYEQEIEINQKKLEHVQDKLILISKKVKKEKLSEEYKQELSKYKDDAELLKEMWQAGEITDEQYWEQIDELRKNKPEQKDLNT